MLIQAILKANYSGLVDDILNVFHYDSDTEGLTVENLEEFNQAFRDEIVAYILPLQCEVLEYRTVFTQPVGGVNFAEKDLSAENGELAEIAAPPFTTTGFKLVRASAATRHGFKRFSGIPKDIFDQNGSIGDSGYAAAAAELAARMHTVIIGGDLVEYTPVIYGRPSASNPTIGRFSQIASVVWNGKVTTQNTRKVGYGS